ncbi:hypothetical protein [Streptomyces humi]
MTASTHGHRPRVPGPDTPLAQVLTCFETNGHRAPSTARHAPWCRRPG